MRVAGEIGISRPQLLLPTQQQDEIENGRARITER
jgi:hypothetical protein